MGQATRIGNNTTLCLDVDSREGADRLYGALSEGGSEGAPMADMPWGVILDRYGRPRELPSGPEVSANGGYFARVGCIDG